MAEQGNSKTTTVPESEAKNRRKLLGFFLFPIAPVDGQPEPYTCQLVGKIGKVHVRGEAVLPWGDQLGKS